MFFVDEQKSDEDSEDARERRRMERIKKSLNRPTEADVARADDVLLQRLAEKKRLQKEKEEAEQAAAC